MRRLFISADIEGCAGVASQQALAPDRHEWAQARRWMTAEALAAATAGLESGFDEVILADGHGSAHNIDPEAVPDGVRLMRSWPRPLNQMEGVQEPGVEACMFIGYHAGVMQAGGVLAHSYSGAAFRDVRLNGESCSEGYLNAAVAGAFDVPVVLVAGDAAAVADAARYAPAARGLAVKTAIGWRAVVGMSPQQSAAAIGEAAKQALAAPRPAPFRLAGPFRLELEMTTQVAAEMLDYLPIFERVSAFAVAARFDALQDVARAVTFAMMYSPAGVMPF